MKLKKIGLPEIEQLQIIGKQTFIETFAPHNTNENIQKYLEEAFSSDKLTSELTNPNAAFYFAILDDKIIGYLKINFKQPKTGFKNIKALEIERIYVLKEFHGKKIGQIMLDTAFDIAKAANAGCVWLGVWGENLKAINFYKKNYFVETGQHFFKMGNEIQTGIVMTLDIN
jgi:diamine N-acetyltransferase